MALIKNGILGKIRGSVGTVTGRIVDGKNILTQRASFRKPVTDPATLKRREKFKLAVKFASAINKMPELKTIWKAVKPDNQNFFSYFVQSNYKQIGDGILTNINLITPFTGFPVSLTSSSVTSTDISIDVEALAGTFDFDLTIEKNIKLCMILFLSDPVDSNADKYFFMPVKFDSQTLQLDNPLSFTKTLLKMGQSIFEKYNSHLTFLALVTLDAEENPVSFSSTFCIE